MKLIPIRSAFSLANLGLTIALITLLRSTTVSAPAGEVLWSIGKPDGYSIEFAPGERDQLSFTVGQSTLSRDFAGHQSGSVGFVAERSGEKPYTVVFDLAVAPAGPYQLLVDLIYKSGAPHQIKVKVNDRVGIFPVRHQPKKSGYGDEANIMLLAQQHLVVPIEAAWLKPKDNRITLIPLGIGGLDYDALTFARCAPSEMMNGESLALRSTVFFRKQRGRLMNVGELVVPFREKFNQGAATIQLGLDTYQQTFGSEGYDFGVLTRPVNIPARNSGTNANLEVTLDQVKLVAAHSFKPAKQWKVFICPKVHNDVGYTDLQPHVNELDNRNTDTALEIMEQFSFYKFNFETAWLVDNYLDCRPEDYRKRFFRFADKGRAVINALYLNLMTGICTGEELYRSMYYTHRLAREHGCNFDYACLTDAPSHSWFIPTLLNDVGIKAFSNGSNQTRAPILHFSDLNENSPFYWEGMNGERIFMWYARSYTQWKRLTGPDFISSAANYDYLQTSVPQFLTQFLRTDYLPDGVMIYGAYVDNAAIPSTGEAELIEQWNAEYEYPKLIVSSDAEYFNYIDKNYGGKLPVYRGDCGAYWEDGAASSAAQTTLNRESHNILPTAETVHSLASLFQERELYPHEDFWEAWKNVMFYDEHTWGAHNSISQPDREFVTRQWEVKESYAVRANLDARNLLARGLNRLCQNIAVEGDTVLAFNWQNYARSEPLEVEVNGDQYLVDLASDDPLPLDVIREQDGYRRVRFLAKDVPAMGYKGYAIRSLGMPEFKGNEKAVGPTLESKFYKLAVDLKTGGLASVYDKVAKRELVDANAPYRLNQYVYVLGGEGSMILNHGFGTPPAKLVVQPLTAAKIVENVKTPFGQRIVVTTSCSNAPSIRSEYLVYDDLKRVDVINTIEKLATRDKEAVYFAYPFTATKPAFELQIQNGWCRPNEDQMPGACREWFTPQNLVHLNDGEFDVAWATPDAPLVCLTDINRGKWPTYLEINNGHIYSYAMHNYWFTNYRAQQGGTLHFRYSLTSGRGISREELARFDADTRAPVLAYPFVSSFSAKVVGVNRPLSPVSGSFLNLEASNLQMVVFKAAEDGRGYILRLRETAGRSGEATLKLASLTVQSAYLCNGVEVNQHKLTVKDNEVTIPFKPNQYVTVRPEAEGAIQAMARK